MTNEKKNEFAKVLADNDLNYCFGWNLKDEFEVEVHEGDWKHDHIRLNLIMEKLILPLERGVFIYLIPSFNLGYHPLTGNLLSPTLNCKPFFTQKID